MALGDRKIELIFEQLGLAASLCLFVARSEWWSIEVIFISLRRQAALNRRALVHQSGVFPSNS
jgi:hypothetical protein